VELSWTTLDEARTLFKGFVHSLEKARRRSKKNREMNYYWKAKDNFKNLMNEIDSVPKLL
jgi:hypothetical protein